MSAELLLGAAVNLTLATAALAIRSLTRAGALTGVVVGFGIWWSGGTLAWALLAIFFVTSTLLSRLGRERKRDAEALTGKGDRRDTLQVIANGGPALLFAVLWKLAAESAFLVGAVAALAAATADTWASEVGLLSRNRPVSLIGFRPVRRGSSGGVTWLGTSASLAGAAFIAASFAAGCALGAECGAPATMAALIAGCCGFLGSIVDSILGATIQARYRSAESGSLTEREVGAGGRRNELAGGLRFVSNDVVNLVSGLAVSGLAVLAAAAILPQ